MVTSRGLSRVLAGVAALLGIVAAGSAHAMLTCKQWRIGPVLEAVQGNGATVRFSLKQSGSRLYGKASYVVTEQGFLGLTSSRKGVYGNVGLGRSNLGGDRFTARVRWSNDSIGNYSARPWGSRLTRSGGLVAQLKGNTYPETGGVLVEWQTYARPGEVQPVSCLPQDVIDVPARR